MAEVYPSDGTLNALTEHALSGVEYIATGQAPYYLHFRKLVYRLLLALEKAGELRVFDEGGISVGVKSGKFMCNGSIQSYAGSTGNSLTDNATNYIYLNGSGALTISTSAYPDLETPHMRLATVVTASGDISSITDDRGQHIWLSTSGLGPENMADADSSSGGMLIVIEATLTAGSTVAVHSSNAPYKFKVIDAWSIALSADGGTWKITDGTNDITDTVTVTGTDKTINKAGTIDDAYNEISKNGSLSVVGDGTLADVDVYIALMRIT